MDVENDIKPNNLSICSSVNCCERFIHIISLNTTMYNSVEKQSQQSNNTSVIFITNINYINKYVFILLILVSNLFQPANTGKRERYHHNHRVAVRVLYQSGIKSEQLLPECDSWTVCNKIDTYSTPWVEKQCRCVATKSCSLSLDHNDGHTLGDKSRQFKLCEPISKLAICRYFRDITWTLTSYGDNTTSQKVNCACPKNSVAYIFKHQTFKTEMGIGYKYHFACSPESKLRCQRKEPCRLFTVRKRPDVEEVNTNTLCQCPQGYACPTHHKEPNVITGTVYPLDHIRTYSGFCSTDSKRMDDNNYIRNSQSLR